MHRKWPCSPKIASDRTFIWSGGSLLHSLVVEWHSVFTRSRELLAPSSFLHSLMTHESRCPPSSI